ncbi:MAG: tRNA (adenosine(37)-N6)-threonylcarbamoyltransferase complex ATPase subunit type 1 TsaE [Bacteroidetes bacterium]|nr:tRNA (adenosine(37)-N6)-threonylcarbamoyltransferase complex ATPase subunit type 1 TsaE [Bacteroidota bacterium]
MRKQFVASNLSELDAVAKEILEFIKEQNIVAIEGKMGAGKTTLIKSICKELGVHETVSSPTFSLVNEYTDAEGGSVFHFDFYRIKKLEEVYDIGYEEYFYSGHFCFIEWPEMITELLPENHTRIKIEVDENEERILICKY